MVGWRWGGGGGGGGVRGKGKGYITSRAGVNVHADANEDEDAGSEECCIGKRGIRAGYTAWLDSGLVFIVDIFIIPHNLESPAQKHQKRYMYPTSGTILYSTVQNKNPNQFKLFLLFLHHGLITTSLQYLTHTPELHNHIYHTSTHHPISSALIQHSTVPHHTVQSNQHPIPIPSHNQHNHSLPTHISLTISPIYRHLLITHPILRSP